MILIIEPTINEIRLKDIKTKEINNSFKLLKINIGEFSNHKQLRKKIDLIKGEKRIQAIAIRLLFGGDLFNQAEIVDELFFIKLRKLIPIRPVYISTILNFLTILHEVCSDELIIAFFETGFFRKLPEIEKHYAIPQDNKNENEFRKWGFHGIWHRYNATIPKDSNKTISIVLDNQTTVCAIENNRPVCISYGCTPLEGIMSKQSCGDLDPGIVFYLMNQNNYSVHEIDDILKRKSGFIGLTGYSLEPYELIKRYGTDKKVELAFNIYINQIKKYIGESIALLEGVDSIVFTGNYVDDLIPIIYKLLKDISFLDRDIQELPWEFQNDVIRITLDNSCVHVYLNKISLTQVIYTLTKEY